jgi:DNA-binding MarR family transcriptional regulator
MPHPRIRSSGRQAAEALARTAPLVSRWIERLLARHEPPLTVPQYLVLQAVDEGEVLGSELARRTAVSPAAVSQLLAALEANGLLGRQRLPDDRRRLPIALTEDGERALRSAQVLLQDRLAELLAELPAPEANALARLLARLEGSLSDTAPPPRPHRPHPPAPHQPRKTQRP